MILDLLAAQAASTPDRPLAVTTEATYSYAEIWSLARRFAARLCAHGIVPGDHVALIAGNSAAYLVAWFGINAAGAVAVCLNNQLMGDAITYLVSQCDAKLVVADTEWIETRAGGLREGAAALPRIGIGSDAAFFAELAGSDEAEPPAIAAHDLCTILYTSGTTGLPKGVMCAHGGYAATGRETVRILDLGRDDRIFVYMPLFHTNPQMYAVMAALTAGASLALAPRFSATSFFDEARALGATGCTFVGTVLAILAARYADPVRDHAMRFAIGGGTTRELASTIETRFGIKVHELYGMTEVGGWVSGSTAADHKLGANGRVRADVEVRIVDADDNPQPIGARGEIVVRPSKPNVILMGYYKKPEELAKASRNFWFHTGDIGSFDDDGYLYFHGRSKEVIRRGGEMISPDELEQHLRKLPGIADCAVVAVPDPIMGDEIKAVVVAEAGFDLAHIRSHLADHVPGYMLPRYAERIDRIPRTQTEKILRRELEYVDARVIDFKK
ncbi:class I adenylate-forming enzyme family protein [Chelatococcus reniformis]|uniref:ATP-dependent acyl-CoA ligase n=1 Tax=Chelatococcus reniformis TaxID=1494448 RepID=A0A916UVX9_9HYPH|nr:AMP-binding protein [Chelatococcus reniformis]GGC91154.1 ATP-dependent acyl-CoA ligase [Chelatococcus reniformis]